MVSTRCSTCNIGRRSIGSAGRSAQCPAFSTQEPHRREWRRSCCRRRARRWACAARACREPHLCPLVVAHSTRRRCRAADGQSRGRPISRLLVAVTFHVKQRALRSPAAGRTRLVHCLGSPSRVASRGRCADRSVSRETASALVCRRALSWGSLLGCRRSGTGRPRAPRLGSDVHHVKRVPLQVAGSTTAGRCRLGCAALLRGTAGARSGLRACGRARCCT